MTTNNTTDATSAGEITADAKATRNVLAESTDSTAGSTTEKVDVKAQTGDALHEKADVIADAVGKAHDSAPPIVARGMEIAVDKTPPLVSKTTALVKAYPKQAAGVAGGLFVLRSFRKWRKRRQKARAHKKS